MVSGTGFTVYQNEGIRTVGGAHAVSEAATPPMGLTPLTGNPQLPANIHVFVTQKQTVFVIE